MQQAWTVHVLPSMRLGKPARNSGTRTLSRALAGRLSSVRIRICCGDRRQTRARHRRGVRGGGSTDAGGGGLLPRDLSSDYGCTSDENSAPPCRVAAWLAALSLAVVPLGSSNCQLAT